MSLSPKCYIPSFDKNKIGLVGSGEEDFEWFLSYMGVAAIMVMWPGFCDQTFVTPTHGCHFDWPNGFREDL